MISFVVWKWHIPGAPQQFHANHVNVLRSMLERHYHAPHRLICITDDTHGLDGAIEALPMPARFDGVGNLQGPAFPACWRRLWNFSQEATVLGPRIVSLDIDVIITRDITDLFDREETFVGWTDPRASWARKIAGGLYLLKTGAHTRVWQEFSPATSPIKARQCGVSGSDQSWMSYCLYPPPGRFTEADGVMSIKWVKPRRPLPNHARIVSTPGDRKPWSAHARAEYPWIEAHWK